MSQEPRDLSVPPAPLPGSGSGRSSAAAALAVVVLVVIGAVAGAQLTSGEQSTPAPTTVAVVTPTPGATPAPTDPLAPVGLPDRLDRQQLTRQVRDGTLDGRLVFIDGHLEAIPLACERPPAEDQACVLLAVDGLRLTVSAGASVLPWVGPPSPNALLVFVAERGGLTYLGSLIAGQGGPTRVGTLTDQVLARAVFDPGQTLFDVEGYLVVNGIHSCPMLGRGATPCPGPPPFLADDPPTADGLLVSNRGATVDLEPRVIGVDPSVVTTPGTFLVTMAPNAHCRPGHLPATCTAETVRWTVVTRYDPAEAVRVVIP